MPFDKNKTIRIITIIISIAMLCFVALTVYVTFFLEFFDSDKQLLASFQMLNSKNRVEIYSMPSNATVQGNIQIYKVDDNNEKTLIELVERYKLVKKIRILSNNSFELVLGNEYSIDYMRTEDSTLVLFLSQ